MNLILESKMFKGSKYQSRILSSMLNPINQKLVQQVSFEDPEKGNEPDDLRTDLPVADHEFEEPSEELENVEPTKTSSEENLEENLEASTSICSSTYVTAMDVSSAVTEIPGLLNMEDSTNGATYAILKNGELWIYFNSDTDITNILDKVDYAIMRSGYYFLSFNRIIRDENAMVYTVNWVSNYFNPMQLKDKNE